MRAYVKFILGGALAGILAVTPAAAQQFVHAKKDWSVFETTANGGKQCWIVTQPTNSRARRGGQDVEVKRGDIFLMVAVRPAEKVKNEVSFLAGYPFRKGSQVKVKIGSGNFGLFTDNETAWAPSTNEDAQLVSAMRRGARAIVEGVSSRGTTTFDTFSLSGFTAALKSAQELCK